MARRLTIQRFTRIQRPKFETGIDSIHFEWAAHFVKMNPEKAMSYLDKCYASYPLDSSVLHLRSVGKRKLARISSALDDALLAGEIYDKSPDISLEICDGLYDLNEFEKCKMELHDDTRKYLGAVVKDFKDRLIVVNENFQDCLGDSLGLFMRKNMQTLDVVSEILKRNSLIDKRPIWKIRKDRGECDIMSIKETLEKLLSPLELARRERAFRIFSQMYFGKNWVDEAFLRKLSKTDKWQLPLSGSTLYLRALLKPEYTIVNKFMRMLHARSPLYNEYIKRFGDQKFLKLNREQYLYHIQEKTRKKMCAALDTLKKLRKLGEIEDMTRYIEDIMGDVLLKTSRIMPWKFEFINEVYNTIGRAFTDSYVIPSTAAFTNDAFQNLSKLLRLENPEETNIIGYEFGNRSTYIPVDSLDPKFVKHKKLISLLKKRLVFTKYPIEECYLFHEMARTYRENHLYDECISVAKKAIEESKKCNNQLWGLISTMITVKTYAYSQKIEYCYDALQDALKIALNLRSSNIVAFIEQAISFSEEILIKKRDSISSSIRRKLSRHLQIMPSTNTSLVESIEH